MNQRRVSVVVPLYNGAACLPRTLAALGAQTSADFEVVVVDDGSTDGSDELALELGSRLLPGRFQLLRQANAGPAAARNAGIAAARGEVIAFTDADVEPEPEWLEQGLAALAAGADGVEGVTLTPDGLPVPPGHHGVFNLHGGGFMTCNMFYRRAALERVGGFDPRFRRPFYEDSDLAFSILEAQGRIDFAPGAVVRHRLIPTGTLGGVREQRYFAYAPLLYRKHPRLYQQRLPHFLKGLHPVHVDFAAISLLTLLTLWAGPRPLAILALLIWTRFFARVRLMHRVALTPLGLLSVPLYPLVRMGAVLFGAFRHRVFSPRL